jgi:hypothetical protein
MPHYDKSAFVAAAWLADSAVRSEILMILLLANSH